jgi:hypothetical protein
LFVLPGIIVYAALALFICTMWYIFCDLLHAYRQLCLFI